MRKRNTMILTAASAGLIFLFFLLPANKAWLKKYIFRYWKEFPEQKKKLDPAARMEAAFGNVYNSSKAVSAFFESHHIHDKVLVLIPPTDYFKKMDVNLVVAEPAVFYYFTGLKTIGIDNKGVERADWMIRVKNDLLIFDSITNRQVLIDSIAGFKKFLKAP